MPGEAPALHASWLRRACVAFWLRSFFWVAEHAPWMVLAARGPLCRAAFLFSPAVRKATRLNAARVLGAEASAARREEVARGVVSSFYLFCYDVGRSASASREELLARIASIEGVEGFRATRAGGKGAIVVTAHMGSFEVGMAALKERERRVHVVFRRDAFGRFERLRSELRRRLDVDEAPVDEGWTVWMRLRDALLAGEAVVLQGDRVMPGQKGERVPFLGGHIMLPSGPVKLALATGAPIVPILSVRTREGRVRLFIEPPIVVERDRPAAALVRWAAVLERYVKTYPDQWLLLQPALVEDQPGAGTAEGGRPS